MMRTIVDGVEYGAVLAEKHLQSRVNAIHFGGGAKAVRDHRLIGHDDGETVGLVDAANRFGGARHEPKVLGFVKQRNEFAERAVAVEENGGQRAIAMAALDPACRPIGLHGGQSFGRSDVFQVLSRTIAVEGGAVSERARKDVAHEVARTFGNVVCDGLRENIDGRVSEVAAIHLFRSRFGMEIGRASCRERV
jgi:hypothetical protein